MAKKRLPKHLYFFVAVSILFALIVRHFYLNQQWEKTLSSIPTVPGAEYLGDFATSYPDDVPSSGKRSTISQSKKQVVDFYQPALAEGGWDLTGKYMFEDPAVPDTLQFSKGRYKLTLIIGGSGRKDRLTIRLEK